MVLGLRWVLLCARLPSVSVRRFESVHPLSGNEISGGDSREGKLKAHSSLLERRGEPRES